MDFINGTFNSFRDRDRRIERYHIEAEWIWEGLVGRLVAGLDVYNEFKTVLQISRDIIEKGIGVT